MNTIFARICWNTNQWKHPSGTNGKSNKPETFENSYGYGNDEWLFNENFCLNGFNYGYLQGLTRSDSYNNQEANVFLWAKKDKEKKQLIGVIHNAKFIDYNEKINVMQEFRKFGILKIIEDDLKKIGVDNKIVKEAVNSDSFFNIKYKYSDLELFENPILGDFITTDRYSLTTTVKTVSKYLEALDYMFQNNPTYNGNAKKTDRISQIVVRIRQQEFRRKLLKTQKVCAITGMNFEKILVASHIKPWKFSNENERVNPNNGLLLIPNLDKLFDLGYISFDMKGRILISKKLNNTQKNQLEISDDMKIKFKINSEMKVYLSWHRKKIYKEL